MRVGAFADELCLMVVDFWGRVAELRAERGYGNWFVLRAPLVESAYVISLRGGLWFGPVQRC